MLLSVVAFGAAWAGFAALALSMNRYSRRSAPPESMPSTATRRWSVRGLGWLGLALSLIACVVSKGGGLGSTLWFGLATVAAITVTLVVTYWPRQLARAALGCGVIASIGFIVHALY